MKQILLSLVSALALAGLLCAQNAGVRDNNAFTVGTGGVTANTLVKTDASFNAIAVTTADTGAYGVAQATVAAAGSVTVVRYGTVSIIADGVTTIGDLAIVSSTVAGDIHDSGFSSSGSVSSATRLIGIIRSVASGAGQTALVELTPFHFGTAAVTGVHQYGASFGSPGGTALTTGLVTYVTAPQGCTIQAWDILADTGTATVKFWKVATGTAVPTSANSINTSGVSLASGTAIRSTTLTDFTTTAVSAHDIIAVTLTAVSGAGFVSAAFECQ